jgi:gamma-glutamyl-gamma-aminobutyrate hydrolase PuuD
MILYSASKRELLDPFGLFDAVEYIEHPENLTSGALILWGGEDIGTSLYGEAPNSFCMGFKPSMRDYRELHLLGQAKKHGLPVIGICRGAQLMCVKAGGKLAQHISGHGHSHRVTLHDEGGVEITCNSSHHQMMLPDSTAKILATAGPTTGFGAHDVQYEHDRVNEVIYFPTLNGLGIQAHPEWDDCSAEFISYCRRKIKEYLHV